MECLQWLIRAGRFNAVSVLREYTHILLSLFAFADLSFPVQYTTVQCRRPSDRYNIATRCGP